MTRSIDLDSGPIWLVCNPASGSNDEATQAQLVEAFAAAGLPLARVLHFPDVPAPTPGMLREAGVAMLAVFAGDGTTHAVVTGAYGWDGLVLVLPGGTKNLLAKRLHGDVAAPVIVARLSDGTPLHRARPQIVRGRLGEALTGVLAGPGAVWNDVREAMRSHSVVDVVTTAREAISFSTNGPRVICAQSAGMRAEGYIAITLVPHEDGLEVSGYYGESLGDFAGHGIALLGREFRNGPHESLGRHPRVRLLCPTGEAIGLLVDGEPCEGHEEEIFELARCEVDLVSTHDPSQGGGHAR